MKLTERLLGALFPPRCVVCREPMPRDRLICPRCETYVNHPAPPRGRCWVCFLPKGQCVCGKKRHYEAVAAPFLSDTPAKASVYAMKFRQQLDLIRPLGFFMKQALDERELTERADLITCIPMGRKARRERGYNQAEELAKEVAKLTGLPFVPLLEKVQETPPQHGLPSRLSRSGNLLGVYEPVKENIPVFQGKTVLLVDDICTTGATFNEAAKTLLIFGAESVLCAAALLTRKEQPGNGKKPEERQIGG